MEDLEKSMGQSLEEVKSGTEIFELSRKKIKKLKTDHNKAKACLPK